MRSVRHQNCRQQPLFFLFSSCRIFLEEEEDEMPLLLLCPLGLVFFNKMLTIKSNNNSLLLCQIPKRMMICVACLLLLLSSTNAGRHPLAFVQRSNALPRTHALASGIIPETSNEWGIPDSKLLPPLGSSTPRPSLPNGGRITLVGSGPGDPDLLTMAAHRLLSDPNTLVIADRLVSQEILNIIPGEIKVARKLPGCAELAQEEIYWWAYQGLNQGKHVVRLKIGDPFVFGRGGEEVLTFRKFGVEAAVIPGVSAAFSAPLLASIPVTHRGVSNQVVMCTGYGREGTSPDLIQYHKEQTIVFLMAVGRLRELCHRLTTLAGYPSNTPVAIVENAGCPTQRTVVGNMETIADLAQQHNVKPPSTIVVGDVVNVLLETDAKSGHAVTGLIQNMTETMVP